MLSSGDQPGKPLYKCRLLRSEDRAFGPKPRPKCSAQFFQGRTRSCVLSFFLSCFSFPRFVAWPLELGLGTRNPRFVAWPLELGLGTLNPRFVAWPLELGLGTRNPRFVACMVVESRNRLLGRRQKELAAKKQRSARRGMTRKGPTGVGTPFGRRKVGKPTKVGTTWGYGRGVRTNDVRAV